MDPALLDKKSYSPDDLLRITDAHRYELIDGMLVERGMGSISSWVGGELYALLRDYSRANRFGWTWHADAGFRCFPHRPGMVRYPDVAVVRFGRLMGEQLPDGHIEIAPDFVAEVVSPNDVVEDLEEKVIDYRAAGVRLIWVIFPALRTARVHRADRTTIDVAADEVLTGESVLPGFEVRLADLFPPTARAQP